MRIESLLYWVGVPVASFFTGTVLGLASLMMALESVSGVLIGQVVAATFAGLVAFDVGERTTPDRSRGRLVVIVLFSVGSLMPSVPVVWLGARSLRGW